jgi:hypothetical protein
MESENVAENEKQLRGTLGLRVAVIRKMNYISQN